MTVSLRFVTAELLAMAVLAPLDAEIVHSTSDQLDPPLIRVRRVPGEPRTHFDDSAHIEYMCFGSTFEKARLLAEQAWQLLEFAYAKGYTVDRPAGSPAGVDWVTVDASATVLAPFEVPWANNAVRVFQGVHQLTTRGLPAY